MSKKSYRNIDYLRMPMEKNNLFLNLGNRILSTSDPLLRPIVKGVRKTAKYLRNKSSKFKFNKSRKYRK